eukprot:1051682-Amphidinium_carterae.1
MSTHTLKRFTHGNAPTSDLAGASFCCLELRVSCLEVARTTTGSKELSLAPHTEGKPRRSL